MSAFNSTAFSRLRWSVFEDPSTIRVADDASKPAPSLTPYTHHHPVALEAACTPPVKEIYFTMQVYGEYEGWDSSPLQDIQRPATAWHEVAVRRSDGDALLVADVVEQLHAYFQEQKDWILEALTPLYDVQQGLEIDTPIPQGARVWFEGFEATEVTGDGTVGVAVWLEGMDEFGVEEFWRNRYRDHAV
ncbi:hypothetical protein HBI24_127760 [Parastagonospora nodorum]|nr:hypothetical protein HBI78_110050 [Parastagonospora nodorum]KAH5122004.1 hypothetical protein HBH71_048320 [Parastagonospora nodorum]KAH5217651.1 hypothetical protein HBH77_050260 [Parastagonospora nodorum]KAH5293767.1 hypothetical protein HBI11_181920 [Parastagonospora nodorum]KAH5474040.1 hypothetical protein HBI28_115640 [Parastagonospora nodorum]